jgi:hypothetical protein
MEPLKGRLTVPCTVDDILGIWHVENTLAGVQNAVKQTDVRLLPPHFDEGDTGVLRDLKDLGVINSLSDGRIQVPDVYRIAFGLGRKGGVKPLK